MALKKNDFIEIEFTGKLKDGEIFDSNIKKDLDKSGLKGEAKPFVFCLGESMFLQGVEDFLMGKEIGEHKIELSPDKAFGQRNSQLIKKMPMKLFQEQKINPVQGAMFNFDGRIAKVLAVSGGRVMVDFNNPLAGKDIAYDIKILRKVEDLNEKIKAMNQFLFRKDFKFEVNNKKLRVEVEPQMVKFVEMFKDKFKEILDLDLEIKQVENKTTLKNNKV